jgi:AraC-like DNA-binding protein
MRFSAANIRLSKGVRPFLIRKHDTQPKPRTLGKPTMVKLLKRVEEQVIDRLGQIDTTDIHAVVLAVCRPNDEHSSPGPCHPACMEFASSSYCRKSWDGYLARLNRCPRTCWGTCLHQRVCAMIPITCQGRSLAVVQLAAPASTEQAEFRRVVDLVELLVRDFVTMHADFLHRVPGGIPARAAVAEGGDLSAGRNHPLSPTHPQVLRAMEQIDANISDPHLNVAGVASVLGMNPTYLSELFVKQLGQRMSGFISARRMENARKLLADTDWQVKRIALEVGYANPNWFGQVFRNHTGQTPLQCRATARASR